MKEYFIKNVNGTLSVCAREEGAARVVGKVSEKAKWIKEGMEFDEADMVAQPAAACVRKSIKRWHPAHLVDVTISFKCPECGIFR